jgi:uncharacterized membrane protein
MFLVGKFELKAIFFKQKCFLCNNHRITELIFAFLVVNCGLFTGICVIIKSYLMKIISIISVVVLLSFWNSSVVAQTTGEQQVQTTQTTTQPVVIKPYDNQLPVMGQFDFIMEKSSRYQGYRVVPVVWLEKLRTNVADSLAQTKKQYLETFLNNQQHQGNIDSLKNELAETVAAMETLRQTQQSMSFLGLQMNKGLYNSIMWGLVLVLVLIIAVLFFLFRNAQTEAKHSKLLLLETQDEYEAHRKRALEREQTMARKHLTEINKLRGER